MKASIPARAFHMAYLGAILGGHALDFSLSQVNSQPYLMRLSSFDIW